MSSRWPGKYIIGLTGNIAVGKSVVRKMLEHLGAYGIDADQLAHRAIAKGAPGYRPVVETFGKWILTPSGEIDRLKLARLVFSDPDAMRRLEAIVHPLVLQAIDYLVRRSKRKVVVIEAIKLLETELHDWCDAIWVVDAPPELQIQRLIHKRGLRESEAYQRILAQPPQSEKVARADVVIRNDGEFEQTWKQVLEAWKRIPAEFREPARPEVRPEAKPKPKPEPAARPAATVAAVPAEALAVRRATPKHAKNISEFIAHVTDGKEQPSRADIIARFGDQAYVLLMADGRVVGLAGWQVENLVARVTELYLLDEVPVEHGLEPLVRYIEENARELQSEAVLLFVGPDLYKRALPVWKRLGYEPRTAKALGIQAWIEAAEESQPPGTILLFKQLRKDRVLHPL